MALPTSCSPAEAPDNLEPEVYKALTDYVAHLSAPLATVPA